MTLFKIEILLGFFVYFIQLTLWLQVIILGPASI